MNLKKLSKKIKSSIRTQRFEDYEVIDYSMSNTPSILQDHPYLLDNDPEHNWDENEIVDFWSIPINNAENDADEQYIDDLFSEWVTIEP